MNPYYKFGINTKSKNLFDYNASGNKVDYSVNESTGELLVLVGFNSTDYMDVSGSMCLMINSIFAGAFYDENYNYIDGIADGHGASGYVMTPKGAVYARISVIRDYYLQENGLEIYAIKQVFPVYNDDFSITYELETSQNFYRQKLSGKISLLKQDYHFIDDKTFDTIFYFYIFKSEDNRLTWENDFIGKFMKTDCEFNADDEMITVQPDVYDQYNDVLAGMEKEYNLIELAPAIERITIYKRPLIQVYLPGESIISCFLGGENWEQDVSPNGDKNALVNTFHFALCNVLNEINITVEGTPSDCAGLYSGKMNVLSGGSYTGYLYPENSNGYECYINYSANFSITATIQRTSDKVPIFGYIKSLAPGESVDNINFDMSPFSGVATGVAHCSLKTYNIYARYLLDVSSILGIATYPLSGDDIVGNNRNYHYCLGYTIDIAEISARFSDEPTEWGKSENGRYFLPPYTLYGQKFYPISQSNWRYVSIWFDFAFSDKYIEENGRSPYTLKDAYPLWSCISVLLKEIAPEIKHEGTEEYSKFLYSGKNPISNLIFDLFVTQKTNILAGEYQTPAQRGTITLQSFTNMLKNCFQCYWYIEDNKFKIEHIQWFRNGGSYSYLPIINVDLTEIENVRNGKKYVFGTNSWKFDKIDMAERFQFSWMDEVSQIFEGYPIEILSKYVTAGKIEEVNVSNFSSDIDMMLLNPSAFSDDGFVIMAAISPNAMTNPDSFGYGSQNQNESGGYSTPTYEINSLYRGHKALIIGNCVAEASGFLRVHFFNSSGADIGYQSRIDIAEGGNQLNLSVQIPGDAATFGFYCSGVQKFKITNLNVTDTWQLPFVEMRIDGGDYTLQNGYMSFASLQPLYWTYNLPATDVLINKEKSYVYGIERKKKQTVIYPAPTKINPMQLVKTGLGNGQVESIKLRINSLTVEATLKYDTE